MRTELIPCFCAACNHQRIFTASSRSPFPETGLWESCAKCGTYRMFFRSGAVGAAAGALATQVGGDHYKTMKIQPMEYSMANGLDACQHTIVKYVTRFRSKGGIEDLKKARHTLDMLIEFERAKVEGEPNAAGNV